MEMGQAARVADFDFWAQGLDRAFLAQVYRLSAIIGGVLALIAVGFDQRQLAFGLAAGTAAGLFSLWTCEMTVRVLFNGGGFPGVKLALGAFLKMPMLLVGLLGIAWASFHGYMNIFAVVAGVVLVHGVMVGKVVSQAAAAATREREQGRR